MPVCSEPGCATSVAAPTYRCPTHQSAGEQARGGGEERERQRAVVARTIAAHRAQCARCGGIIAPSELWDLGNTDDRTGWTTAEHMTCDGLAGERAAHR